MAIVKFTVKLYCGSTLYKSYQKQEETPGEDPYQTRLDEFALPIGGYYWTDYNITDGAEMGWWDESGYPMVEVRDGADVNIYYSANLIEILYKANGGTVSNGYTVAGDGTIMESYHSPYFGAISYGETAKPKKPEVFGLVKSGYTFIGWKVVGTNAILDSNVEYDSTVYNADVAEPEICSCACYLEAQWTPNTLTVNYYSNYADYGTWQGVPLDVSADKSVLVHTGVVVYDTADDLTNVQNPQFLFLSRTDYSPTGYWGTLPNGGELVHGDTSYPTGQALAEALGGINLSAGSASVDVYAQWLRNFNIDFNGKFVNEVVFNEQPVKHLVLNGETLF